MSIYLYSLYTVAYAGLLVYGARLWLRQQHVSTLLLLVVTFGVFYDNLILTLGNWVGAGALLHALSLPRFVLHQLALPWIIYAAYDQARQAGQGWAQRPGQPLDRRRGQCGGHGRRDRHAAVGAAPGA